jgi:hypothetical protein
VGPAVRRLSRRHPVGHLACARRRHRDRHHGERHARHSCRPSQTLGLGVLAEGRHQAAPAAELIAL